MRRVRVMGLFCVFMTATAAAEPRVPSDFRITIHDYPGLSEWKAFETTITADGAVRQKVLLGSGGWRHKRASISPHAAAQLFDVVEEQRFFSLAAEYPGDAEDCATFVISVRASGQNHSVTFATCFRSRGSKVERKRFLRVWAAALRAYPSPNKEQNAKEYDR
jgi:hypothetical protein